MDQNPPDSLSQGDIKLEEKKPVFDEQGRRLIYCSDGVITEDDFIEDGKANCFFIIALL